MTLTDEFLDEVAKLINGEAGGIPSYTMFADGEDVDADELDRWSVTSSRAGNVVTYVGIRPGAAATPVTGDTIERVGLNTLSSAGITLADADVPGVLHTDDFDFEVDWQITVNR